MNSNTSNYGNYPNLLKLKHPVILSDSINKRDANKKTFYSYQNKIPKIVLYALRELHFPVLLPVYYELIRMNAGRVGFMAPPYVKSEKGFYQEGLSPNTLKFLEQNNIPFWGHEKTEKYDCVVSADVCYDCIDGWGPIVCIGHGTISKGIYFTDKPISRRENFATVLCVPGSWYKQSFGNQVITSIEATGFSKMDELYCYDQDKSQKLIKSMGFSSEKTILLFAPTFNPEFTSMLALYHEWTNLNSNKYQVIFKLHGAAHKEIQEAYKKLADSQSNFYYAADPSIMPYMQVCDILISDVSSVYVEFLVTGKPIILFNNPDMKKYSGYDPQNIEYLIRDAAYRINHASELKNILFQLNNNDFLKQKRQDYSSKLFPMPDGQNSKRIAEQIIKVAKGEIKLQAPGVHDCMNVYLPYQIKNLKQIKENLKKALFPVKVYSYDLNLKKISYFPVNHLANGEIPQKPFICMTGEYDFPINWDYLCLLAMHFHSGKAVYGPVLQDKTNSDFQKHSLIFGRSLDNAPQDYLQSFYKLNCFDKIKPVTALKLDGMIFSDKVDSGLIKKWLEKLNNSENQKVFADELRQNACSIYVLSGFYGISSKKNTITCSDEIQKNISIDCFQKTILNFLQNNQIEKALSHIDFALKVDPLNLEVVLFLRELENQLGKDWLNLCEKHFFEKLKLDIDMVLNATQFENSKRVMGFLINYLKDLQSKSADVYENDLISIVIPCFNCEPFIKSTIQSVFQQKYKNWEIIVIDDASTDESVGVINQIIHENPEYKIQLIKHKKNHGPSTSRNHGIKYVRGKYLVFLDADDEILPEFLSELYKIIKQDSNTGWVYPLTIQYGIINRIWSFFKFDPVRMLSMNLNPVNCLIKKSLLENIGDYDENMKDGYEDWDLWIRAVRKGYQGKLCKKILFVYYKRKYSILHNQRANGNEFKAKLQLINNNIECYVNIGQAEIDLLKKQLRIHPCLINSNFAEKLKNKSIKQISFRNEKYLNQKVKKRILFYFFKNVHIPILIPIYKKFKELYPEHEIAFGYMSYSPQIRAGFTTEELNILKSYNEKMYEIPQDFKPDISFIADSVYPWTKNCGKLINVGHGVLSKGQYYTDTKIARREEQADLICVPGSYHEKIMKKIISKPVIATGMAKLDDLFSGKINKRSIIKHFNLPENNWKYILFAPTFNDELSCIPFIMDKINMVIPDNETFLIIKLHGSTDHKYKKMYHDMVEKDQRVIYADELDITPFLALCDIMISDVSSVIMEFAALNKPVILFNNPNWHLYPNYNPNDIEFKWRDIGLQVHNLKEMKSAVEQSFLFPEEYAEKRKYYTDQLFTNKYDAGACERIIKYALTI
ncbi:hypothetical protein GMMP15_1130010 [Candidatus Magnetomoraceae bacterium gMMP-15]